MTRPPLKIDGVEHDLSHLNPFVIEVASLDPTDAPCRILVTFSHHVYSEKWVGGDDPAHEVREGDDSRCFCPIRYKCSLVLRQAIGYHANGKAYESWDGRGLLRHFFNHQPKPTDTPYPIYFRLEPAQDVEQVDGIMKVVSAYEFPALRPKSYQTIKFGRLVSQVIGFTKAITK